MTWFILLFSEEQLMSRDKRLTCHEYQFSRIEQLIKLSQAGLPLLL
jgi:hypothetical protein